MDGKFSAILKEMFGDERLKALDIAVYAALDSFSGGDGEAWPALSTIAQRAKVSLATVKRSLPRLEGAGYIVRQRRHMSSSKELDTTLYRMVFRRKGSDPRGPLAARDIASCRTDETSDKCGSALSARDAGSDGAEVSSEKYDMSVPSVQDVGSERARNYTHRTRTNEREDGARNLPSCVGPSMPSGDTKTTAENPKGDMTHATEINNLFDELWDVTRANFTEATRKEAFTALFPAGISPETMTRRLAAINERFAEQLIQRGGERYIPSLRNWLAKEGICDV